MAKKIKLTYFDGKGRGELSRLILAHGGVPYEDHRVSFAEWPALKPSKLGVILINQIYRKITIIYIVNF